MKFVIQTADGQTLDTSKVKYLEMDGQRYAMMPVVSVSISKPTKSVSTRKLPENTTAARVRDWLDNAKVGESITMKAPTRYAISAPAEMRNQCIKIKPLSGKNFRLTYMGEKFYARSLTV